MHKPCTYHAHTVHCTYHAYTVVELRNLVLPDREWNVPGDGGGAGGDGGGGGGSGGDDGGVQGTKPEAVRAPPAEPRPPSGTGTRNLLCSKGCGRSFGWPPARASHEKLCRGNRLWVAPAGVRDASDPLSVAPGAAASAPGAAASRGVEASVVVASGAEGAASEGAAGGAASNGASDVPEPAAPSGTRGGAKEVLELRRQVARLQAELDALRRARPGCVVLSVVVGGDGGGGGGGGGDGGGGAPS